ncbi:MAG TPA: tetratricopeptide repeat protein, partial [Geothrix sp.]|nr:tetratricopeptide repeat protein [Geothrix sp.]
GGKGLWIGLAALLLAGIGGTSWWLLRSGASSQSPALPTDTDATTSTPGESGTRPRPAAGAAQQKSAGAALGDHRPDPSVPSQGGSQAAPEPVGGLKPAGQKAESRPSEARTETRAIDQPELYQQEKLEKLQVHERLNLGNVSLSEAIQLADSKPDQAIQGFRQAIKADPYNANAHAWLAVVLHDQGRNAEFVQEIREARRMGLLGQMTRNPRFRSALNQARFNRKLPSDLLD